MRGFSKPIEQAACCRERSFKMQCQQMKTPRPKARGVHDLRLFSCLPIAAGVRRLSQETHHNDAPDPHRIYLTGFSTNR